jgi:hypothetical protein
MKIADRDPLGPDFDLRLRAALDRIVPPTPYPSGARYKLMAIALNRRTLGFASLLAAASAAGIVLLSGFAATGSPNPVVWSQRAASTIQSVSHIPDAPKAEPSEVPSSTPSGSAVRQGDISQPSPAPHAKSSEDQRPEGSDGSWKTPHPEPSESPDPSHNQAPSDDGQPHSQNWSQSQDWSYSHYQNPLDH